MEITSFTGWDIGGAHLKLACVNTVGEVTLATQLPMPLWRGMHNLEQSLAQALQLLPATSTVHSITGSAELVDIFKDRDSGVNAIVSSICKALNSQEIRLYAGRAGWVSPLMAGQHAVDIASANWHATASYVAGCVGNGILMDIGSTTTDIVIFANGQVRYYGYSDFDRLSSSELVYTGIVRTPVMAVTDRVPVAGNWQPVMAEMFATMADVYRLTEELQDMDDLHDTPDGCGKTPLDSARRLARMFGADVYDQDALTCWRDAAQYIADAQLEKIDQALQLAMSRQTGNANRVLVGAGAGRFLAQKLALRHGMKFIDFSELFPAVAGMKVPAAVSAPAVSVAQLARLRQ